MKKILMGIICCFLIIGICNAWINVNAIKIFAETAVEERRINDYERISNMTIFPLL